MRGNESQDVKTPDNKPKVQQGKNLSPEEISIKSIDDKDTVIDKVYKRRHLGKEKLSWITKDGVHHGFKATPIYATIQDDKGVAVPDESVTIGVNKHFTIDYSEKLARKLVDTAFKTCVSPMFYLVDDPDKYGFRNPRANFLKPFDELINITRERKSL